MYILKYPNFRTAKSIDGDIIHVQIIASERKQNISGGFKWVKVGEKVLLDSGREINFNLDGRSFYVAPNQMYRL